MMRWSVSSDGRRPTASRRARCARFALVLLVVLAWWLPQPAGAQSPTVPPPESPDAVTSVPTPADAIPPLPAPVPVKPAQPAAPPRESEDLATALERRGDLNLHGLSLNSALFTIGEQWNINIVAGNVEGTVNGAFKQAPLREILDSILLSNGYNYRVVGKSLVVSSIAELGQINPFFQSATIKVHSADIDEVVEGAKLLNTPQGQIRAIKSVRSIVVLDFPDRVKMIREFVTAIDGASSGRLGAADGLGGMALNVAQFRTQHIRATAAATALSAVLSKDGRVSVVEKDDRLVITDYDENLAMIEKVLDRIDRPRPQVRITALIYDISLQDLERIGIRWNAINYSSNDLNVGVGLGTESGVSAISSGGISTALPAGSNLAFGALTNHFDIGGVAFALQQAKDARLLADPNVAVLENEQAMFKSVREIPIQQLTETAQGGNIGTTAFREAGIKLTVTPKIAADCTILMEVIPEFSRFVGNDENGQPIIDTREAKTTLRVGNRQTVVIAGLRQRDDIGDFSGIPYLKDLKYVGRLFKSRNTEVRESELVVFISPEIIDCVDEPNDRQKMAEETVRCRLKTIPEGEGCPPCCRRLPPEMVLHEAGEPNRPEHETLPVEEDSAASLDYPPIQQPDNLPPLSAAGIPSAEFQFGVAGRAEHVRTLVAEGRLRRLPNVAPVEPQIAVESSAADGLFSPPLAPQDGRVRAAEGPSSAPILR